MDRLALGRIASALVTVCTWLLAGAQIVLAMIGYSTVPEDIGVAQTRLDQFIGWLLGVPWEATLAVALVATIFLMWVSWPRQSPIASQPQETRTAEFAEVELFIDPKNFRAREVASINIFDTTTAGNQDGVTVHLIFDKPIIDPTVSLITSNKKDVGFSYVTEKTTSRFCAVRVRGIEFPCTLNFEVHGRNYGVQSVPK